MSRHGAGTEWGGRVGSPISPRVPQIDPQRKGITTVYVYIRSESQLWTVGFYRPDGRWEPESDHGSPEAAAKRVRYLNGGSEEPEGEKDA